MNKIFKIIWNKTTQRLEVVSELAKSQGKAKASTDKRESLNDSSLKGFKLTQGLKPLSLLVAFAIAMPSYAAVTEYNRNQPNSLHIWGKKNVSQGNVNDAIVEAAVIAGTGNALGDERPGGVYFAYDNRLDESDVQKTPNGINIFGRDNKVNVGNKVNVVGINNTILNNRIGNSGRNLAINAMGNNIAVMNPRRGSYFGNDINANSAYLGIGNNLTVAAGGQAVGTDITVAGDSMAIGSTITSTKSNNFLVGDNLTATNQSQFIAGKNITSGLLGASLMGRSITINQGWADNLLAVGNELNITVPSNNRATEAVVMGVKSNITGGVKAVTIGSNVTSESASNSVTIGSDISTNKPNTVTIGSGNTKTEQNYSIAIGNNASTLNDTKDNGIAIGRNSVVRGDSGIALGLSAESYNDVDVAIGRNSKTDANTNSTLSAWNVSGENVLAKYNKQGTIQTTGSDNGGVVSFGSSTVKRQLKNVAAGDVSATSTDAINGAQLYALAEVVKPGTLTINAGTTKVADWKANSDKTIGFESTNSNLAVSADTVNGKVKFTLANDLSVNSVTASGVEIGKNNVAVNANNKKITRLADAELSTISTDAVTGRQLQSTNENVTNVQNIANTANTNASAAKQAADNAAAAVRNSYLHVNSSKTGNLGALNATANATGANSIALGPNATAAGPSSIAIGDEAVTSSNQGTIAIGQNAAANTNNATVIGRDAKTEGLATDSVVIGLGSIARNTSATAIGKNANASGASSISIGQNTVTTGSATAALGYNVTATANNATAVGSYGNASGSDSITVGAASASNNNAVAIGKGANTTGSSGTAVGTEATATGNSTAALGQKANATGLASVALGFNATAAKDWSISIGGNSAANGVNATSIGRGAVAGGEQATALGAVANAGKDKSLALGRGATANTVAGDVAIGDSSVTAAANAVSDFTIGSTTFSASNFVKETSNGVVSVGSGSIKRQIQNVGAGAITATSTDAINGSQLYHVASTLNTVATEAKTTADNAAAAVDNSYLHVNSSKAGNRAKLNERGSATGTDAIALGPDATASGNNSIALGSNVTAGNAKTISIGQDIKTSNVNSVSIGLNITNGAVRALAMGEDTVVGGYADSAIAIGRGAKLDGTGPGATNSADRSIALGQNSYIKGQDSVAVGYNSNVTAEAGIALGREANVTKAAALALGKGAQATATEGDIALGYGATTAAQNAANSFTVNNKNVGASFVQGSNKGVLSVGNATVNRQIQNVGAGAITATSTDAINGSQLYHVATELNTLATDAKTAADSATGKVTALEARKQTFKVKNADTEKATKDGKANEWTLNKNNEVTFGATSDLTVSTDGNGNIVYGLSTTAKEAVSKAAQAVADIGTIKTDVADAKQKAAAASTAASTANSKATAADSKATAADSKAEAVKETVNRSGLEADGQNTKIGSGATYAGGSNATAIGGSAKATAENTTAVGQGSEATAKGATAIGQGAKATAENAVAIGTGSVAAEANTVSIGSQGNERRITNVAAGVNPTDAANVGQVNAVENRINNKLGKLDKKLRSGVASAVAVANIPQVTIPGASMVALGVGNYKGQSAVAVGYSRASDSNRVIIKMTAGASTQRDYTFGAGIGYQW